MNTLSTLAPNVSAVNSAAVEMSVSASHSRPRTCSVFAVGQYIASRRPSGSRCTSTTRCTPLARMPVKLPTSRQSSPLVDRHTCTSAVPMSTSTCVPDARRYHRARLTLSSTVPPDQAACATVDQVARPSVDFTSMCRGSAAPSVSACRQYTASSSGSCQSASRQNDAAELTACQGRSPPCDHVSSAGLYAVVSVAAPAAPDTTATLPSASGIMSHARAAVRYRPPVAY